MRSDTADNNFLPVPDDRLILLPTFSFFRFTTMFMFLVFTIYWMCCQFTWPKNLLCWNRRKFIVSTIPMCECVCVSVYLARVSFFLSNKVFSIGFCSFIFGFPHHTYTGLVSLLIIWIWMTMMMADLCPMSKENIHYHTIWLFFSVLLSIQSFNGCSVLFFYIIKIKLQHWFIIKMYQMKRK